MLCVFLRVCYKQSRASLPVKINEKENENSGDNRMGLFKYLMSGDGRKSLKKLNKMADKVEALESKYQAMDDDTLKNQTNVLKERLQKTS